MSCWSRSRSPVCWRRGMRAPTRALVRSSVADASRTQSAVRGPGVRRAPARGHAVRADRTGVHTLRDRPTAHDQRRRRRRCAAGAVPLPQPPREAHRHCSATAAQKGACLHGRTRQLAPRPAALWPLSTARLTRAFARAQLDPTKTMISSLIEIELAYINTSHPDFIGGSKAVAALMERMQQQKRQAQVFSLRRRRQRAVAVVAAVLTRVLLSWTSVVPSAAARRSPPARCVVVGARCALKRGGGLAGRRAHRSGCARQGGQGAQGGVRPALVHASGLVA